MSEEEVVATCCGKIRVTGTKGFIEEEFLRTLRNYITNEKLGNPVLEKCYSKLGLLDRALESGCFVTDHSLKIKTEQAIFDKLSASLAQDLGTIFTKAGRNEEELVAQTKAHHAMFYAHRDEVEHLQKLRDDCLDPEGNLARFVQNHWKSWLCCRDTKNCNNKNCRAVDNARAQIAREAKSTKSDKKRYATEGARMKETPKLPRIEHHLVQTTCELKPYQLGEDQSVYLCVCCQQPATKHPSTAVEVSTAEVNYFVSNLNDLPWLLMCLVKRFSVSPGSDGLVCRNCVREAKHDLSKLLYDDENFKSQKELEELSGKGWEAS
jgi:hypothetical protein